MPNPPTDEAAARKSESFTGERNFRGGLTGAIARMARWRSGRGTSRQHSRTKFLKERVWQLKLTSFLSRDGVAERDSYCEKGKWESGSKPSLVSPGVLRQPGQRGR